MTKQNDDDNDVDNDSNKRKITDLHSVYLQKRSRKLFTEPDCMIFLE